MSGSCARPECQELAAFWYLALPARQVVEVFGQDQPHCVALCKAHFLRFSLPVGWELKRLDLDRKHLRSVSDLPCHSNEASEAPATPPQAETSRSRQPWFVNDLAASGVENVRVEQSPVNGGVGLLDRAFNGPQSASTSRTDASGILTQPGELIRAELAGADSERAAKNAGYEVAELPFPPSNCG